MNTMKTYCSMALLFGARLCFAQAPEGAAVEIFVEQDGLSGSTSVTYEMHATSSVWGSDLALTDESSLHESFLTITGTNYGDLNAGWDFVTTPPSPPMPKFSFALYRFTCDHEIQFTCYMDYRDCNYNGSYFMDTKIVYHSTSHGFQWTNLQGNPIAWHSINSGDTLRIWQMENQSSYSTLCFQPTDPSNLTVTRQTDGVLFES